MAAICRVLTPGGCYCPVQCCPLRTRKGDEQSEVNSNCEWATNDISLKQQEYIAANVLSE